MNRRDLAWSSVRFHFRSHLGVVLGAALAAAVLIGALAVGDSVKASLRAQTEARLGPYAYALHSADRFFSTELVKRLADHELRSRTPGSIGPFFSFQSQRDAAVVLQLPGRALRTDGSAQANRINVYGVESSEFFFPDQIGNSLAPGPRPQGDQVYLNATLAAQLQAKIGDTIILRIQKPTALSQDAIITPRDNASVALRMEVAKILSPTQNGNLALDSGFTQPLNCFMARERLAEAAGLGKRANLLLLSHPGFDLNLPNPPGWRQQAIAWCFKHRFHRIAGLLASDVIKQIPRNSAAILPPLTRLLAASFTPEDAELTLRATNSNVELTTRRIFLEPAVVRAALTNRSTLTPDSSPRPTPILTYLVNSLRHGDRLAPYSMVTAAGAPYTPADLGDGEIVVNQWLADDLGVKPGDTVDLAYYRADAGTQLVEHTNQFRIRSVVPIAGIFADRSLMPEFPGLSKAESTHDWDAGFELIHPIRDQDEAYWKNYRGTPKAFITLTAGQQMWANRFGALTGIRWLGTAAKTGPTTNDFRTELTTRLTANLDPAEVGLRFEPIRERALAAAQTGTGNDFGGLFISLSFFLIASALLLTAMLFRFSLEQRAHELGTLLALGWSPKRVRNLFLREGLILAALGSIAGSVLGILYGRTVVYALNTFWTDAVAGGGLIFETGFATVALGIGASIMIAAITLWWTLRSALKRPARELLNEGLAATQFKRIGARSWTRWIPLALALSALGLAATSWTAPDAHRQEAFFFAGILLLVGGLWSVRNRLRPLPRTAQEPARTFGAFARRAPARQPSRSFATITLLAVATFLIVAIAAYRLEATRDATARSAGTGGFALWGESTMPISQDLNVRKGQEFFSLNPRELTNVSVVSLRVRDGDEASCLNLSRAQLPRLLGVHPADLARRGAFSFTAAAPGMDRTAGWKLLTANAQTSNLGQAAGPEIPAIGDAQSIQWALGKSLGDTLDYVDEHGQAFRVRLVGAVANSILQGSLIIDEAELVKRFPSSGGFRTFLIDIEARPENREAETRRVSGLLSRALQDVGFEVIPTTTRLARFNAVQNTYLNTFQVLGGLGLLLGSIGLGVVVLRNVFERRGELAVMAAIGLSRKSLLNLLLREHILLLLLGLGLGCGAAVVAVLPALGSPTGSFPWGSTALTLAGVLTNGLIWTWWTTRRAMAGDLLAALRGE